MIAVDLGMLSYDHGLRCQQKAHADRVQGRISDIIFLLEHEPVITIGRSGGEEDLLLPEEQIIAAGVSVARVKRGGKITCHYPGQLVVYPIMDIGRYNHDVPGFVFNLEETVIRTLADFHIRGERISGYRGVFVGNNKIAAVGIEVRNAVTMHGLSFNVMEDLSLYSLFVPCGITDKGIAFLENYLEPDMPADMALIKERILFHLSDIFQQMLSTSDIDTAYKIA